MNKKILLILVAPMALFGMHDPREDHHPIEDSLWSQAWQLTKTRIKENGPALVGTGFAIKQSIDDAAPLDHIDLVWDTAGKIDKAKSLKTGGYAPNGDPLVSPVKATILTIGVIGALKVASEVKDLTQDVLNLRQKKALYLKAKQEACERYDEKQARLAKVEKIFEEISWQ